MKQFFPEDRYDTPPDTPLFLGTHLFGWTRWNLYFRFFRIVLRSRAMAVRSVYDDQALAEQSYLIIKAVEGCGGKFHIRGFHHIRETEGPVVFVANHMSTLETTIFPALITPIKSTSFVVKDTLVRGPVFGPVMRSLDPIAVTRKDPRKDLTDVLEQGVRILEKGRSIVIFPQSTRSYEFDPARFNTLGIKLASRAHVPIIPVAIKTDFWSNGVILRGFGKLNREEPIHIEFGPPVSLTGRGKEEHRKIIEFISNRLREWGVPVIPRQEQE
ncbi:MAG: 1-acyl-sn-glycerol-3-phosphate acyltransferase [Spirochaetes bacterium]|nr:1-acyl-sn-glycerol-3-phosphate acyltransferase [Spirochaetota bacterium]